MCQIFASQPRSSYRQVTRSFRLHGHSTSVRLEANAIHIMIRVLDLDRSIDFRRRAFGFGVANRLDFDGFALVYLRNEENDFEIELTRNDGRKEPCAHGSGYGDVAMYVDDCKTEHARFECEDSTRTPSRGTTATRRSGRGSSSAGVPTVTGSKCSKGMGATGSGAT